MVQRSGNVDLLTQGAITIFVGILVWYLTSRIEAIRREREKLQDERRKIYMTILDPSIRIFGGVNNPSETKKALSQITSYEYRRTFFELSIIGSDAVVRAVNRYMQFIYNQEKQGTLDGRELLVNWGGLILAFRRDLGNKGTKLDERDMLKALIKDINSSSGPT